MESNTNPKNPPENLNRKCVCGDYEGMHGPAGDCWESFGFDENGEQIHCKCQKFTYQDDETGLSRAREVL
jgi:hypothetical protein